MVFETLAVPGAYPSDSSTGNVTSVPLPTTVLMAPAATPETRIARAAAPLIAAGHPTGPARSGMLLGVLALAAPERAAVRAGCRAARRGGTAVDAALAAAGGLAGDLAHPCGVGGGPLPRAR